MSIKPLLYGQTYHIYNRGNNRENLFVESRNYPYFLKLYAKHILPVADTFAYSLLPNHFHFAIRTRTEEEQEAYWREQIAPLSMIGPISPFKLRSPSQAFKNLFIAYTRAFNRATDRTGTLFERPFHRKPVDGQAYLLTLISYIHLNPQKHGLIDDFRNWKWSSYGAYCSDRPSNIQREQVIAWYGGQRSFFEAHEDLTNLQDLSNQWEPT
jgi:REP element-mobilizing transposase RayT